MKENPSGGKTDSGTFCNLVSWLGTDHRRTDFGERKSEQRFWSRLLLHGK